MARRRPAVTVDRSAARAAERSASAAVANDPPSSPNVQPAPLPTVLIAESGKNHAARAIEVVEGLGYRAILAAPGVGLADIVLAGLPGAEPAARAAREHGDDRPSLIVAVSGTVEEGLRRSAQLGADAFVLRPYRRDVLAGVLRAAALLRVERRRAAVLAADLETERARPLRFGEVDPATGFPSFDRFHALLLLELKRAKRYGYPLAACLVAVDLDPGTKLAPALHAQVARTLRAMIRDIDMPVDYADGKFLVLLPYTDLTGAEKLGQRLELAIRGPAGMARSAAAKPETHTISVGIAALRPGRPVSFARLVHDAAAALRAARLKGGGRVVVRA